MSLEKEVIVLEKAGKNLEFWIQKSVQTLEREIELELSLSNPNPFTYLAYKAASLMDHLSKYE